MDLAMQWRNGYGYLHLVGPDLVEDDGLRSAVLVSLFTDRQAHVDDRIPDGSADRRGHWSDSYLPGDEQIGSRLWLLDREKIQPEVLRRAEDYSREALAWMTRRGAARSVQARAWTTGRDDLNLQISITRPNGQVESFDFLDMWKKEAQHAL